MELHKQEVIDILDRIMECWRLYGLFYGVETSYIINILDGRIKKIYDDFEKLSEMMKGVNVGDLY